ncbi:MAG: thiamine phosphate synthase [Phycisphaerales bacterium]|nr:thiamine phosphate synthase [Phycisphaerales bacterium]MCB9856943.1 thiamine phosphate synthase [Phycisphaerales bacterium]MCB9861930.1 thiamine phosphate synthase [Phycisphaerales bacterium]
MNIATYRILDANLNRAREGLRVLEEYARFALNDAVASEAIKIARHVLAGVAGQLGRDDLLACRDTPGDVGTSITTTSESSRADAKAVAQAASARVGEALRCIEEYGKLVSTDAAKRIERLRYDLYSIEQNLFAIAPRRSRLREARLHVLLTESLCRKPWLETAEAVLQAGADVIQLREKSLSDSALLSRSRTLRELTRRFNALLVINDRPDVARLCCADAVHLGQDDMPIAEAREIVGPTVLVGGSAHDRQEIEEMLSAGVDYLGVGPMFASGTKPDLSVRGPELLSLAIPLASAADVPLVAIGGISTRNAASLRSCGSARVAVAVCADIVAADDPADATRRLLAAIGDEIGTAGNRS